MRGREGSGDMTLWPSTYEARRLLGPTPVYAQIYTYIYNTQTPCVQREMHPFSFADFMLKRPEGKPYGLQSKKAPGSTSSSLYLSSFFIPISSTVFTLDMRLMPRKNLYLSIYNFLLPPLLASAHTQIFYHYHTTTIIQQNTYMYRNIYINARKTRLSCSQEARIRNRYIHIHIRYI